jgi:hypothetical protein
MLLVVVASFPGSGKFLAEKRNDIPNCSEMKCILAKKITKLRGKVENGSYQHGCRTNQLGHHFGIE